MKDKLREQEKALIANLAAVVRVQNGNKHDDINQLLAHADELLATLDADGDGGAVGGKYTDVQIEAMVALHWDHSLHTAAVPPDVSRVTADMLRYLLASRKHPARSGVVSDEDVRDAERYREFCKQASEASFPISLLEDAFEMGSGVLNLHFDGAKGERHER